jgi:hypothetical protein
MEGNLDFRSMTVGRKVVSYMVSNAFGDSGGASASGPQGVTRITCDGPVTLRRFEQPEDIGLFLKQFDEKLKPIVKKDEGAVVAFIAELQKRMREESVAYDDKTKVLAIAGDVAEAQHLRNGKQLFKGEAGDALMETVDCLYSVSPDFDGNELALLRGISAKIDSKDIDLSGPDGLSTLTLVIFDTNVRAATRPSPMELGAMVEREDSANAADFSAPYVDSTQECERMIIYCREQPSDRKGGGQGIEPVKVEMMRGASQVVIRSFGPRSAERKELDTYQTCDRADIYTARRSEAASSGEQQQTRFVQTRMLLAGAVNIQKFEYRQKKDEPPASTGVEGETKGDDAALTAIYNATGEVVEWDRETGHGVLVGKASEKPTLTYSSAPSDMSPDSTAKAGANGTASNVVAYATNSIEFFRMANESMTRVRFNGDVVVERTEISARGKRLDSLKHADWAEMVFRQSAAQGQPKALGPGGDIFSNLESMKALGKVDFLSDKGEAWGDYMTHEKGKHEGHAAAITTLYKITEANRKGLIGDAEFKPGDWPLMAVMTGAGGSEFLGTTKDDNGPACVESYTANCDESIQYVDYTEKMPVDGKVIFTRKVKIDKSRSDSKAVTTLEASRRVDMDFVRSVPAGESAPGAKGSFDLRRLYAEGNVHMTEPEEKGGVSKLQEAKGDRLTWTSITPEESGGKAADRVVINGAGDISPEIRYTVSQKVATKKADGTVETKTQEEQTIVTCAADGGKITVYTLHDPKQREKLEDNYVLAEGGASVHRTGATIDAAKKRQDEAPIVLKAQKLTTYYIPATEKGASSRVKKIIAEENVVATSDEMTAEGARGVWERFYQPDILEQTTLTAAPGGTAKVRFIGKDKRGRPTDTTITCSDKAVFNRTIYDAGVSPQIAAKGDAVFTNTVSVARLGFADKAKKLNEDLYLNCDQLKVTFADTLRNDNGSAGRMDIQQMIASGKTTYQIFNLLKEEHKYPNDKVLYSEGKAEYLEYNKDNPRMMLRMKGKRGANGRLLEPADRYVYTYDPDTRKQTQFVHEYEHDEGEQKVELPPLPAMQAGFNP